MTSLELAVRDLALARAVAEENADELREAKAAFDAQHRELIAKVKEWNDRVVEADRTVRVLTISAFDATQERKPCDGVEVVLTDAMDYKEEEAFGWAQTTGLALTPARLDTKAFAKIAKATPLPFVTYRQAPSVRIASDLSEVLAAMDTVARSSTESAPF